MWLLSRRQIFSVFGSSLPPHLHGITDAILGVSIFSNDILVMPGKWVSNWHKRKLLFHRTHDKGGHFRE
jgi:hypothetical protein